MQKEGADSIIDLRYKLPTNKKQARDISGLFGELFIKEEQRRFLEVILREGF